MSLLAKILESFCGKAQFVISIDKKPAIEINIEDKEILVDVKNPVLAFEFGIQEILKKKKSEKSILKYIKKMGFKIKIKYKMFKLEI